MPTSSAAGVVMPHYGVSLADRQTKELTQGWTFTVFEEAFNQGYPQELAHFIHCVRTGEKPLVTGEDGRAVLEMVYAAYASAKEGRKIALPFSAKVKYPIELMR